LSFDRPLVLVALIAIPLLVLAWRRHEQRRARQAAAFSTPALIPNLVSERPGRRRSLPLAILLAALAVLIFGAAKPHASVSTPRKEATVVLALDISRSMTAKDVRPTRLDAARNAAYEFLNKVPKEYSVAVVGFGTRAFVALPPTTDRVLAHDALASLTPSEGTAIGDAISLSTRLGSRRRESDGAVPPTSVLLISDGARDGGQTDPIVAARRARALHIPVSTVLVGTPAGVVTNKLVGGYQEQIRVPPSPGTLQRVAQVSGGEFFQARTSAALTSVYKKLGTRIGHKTQKREISDLFAGGGLVLLLVGGGLSALWLRRPVP
jgi:Ca-activated chloride channel family protein